MTDNRIPPSALVPASGSPVLSDAALEAVAAKITGQHDEGYLTAFEAGDLLWANVAHSKVIIELADEEMRRVGSDGEPAPGTKERLASYLIDTLGKKLREKVNCPGGYEFAKARGASFVGWVRKIGRSIVEKAGWRINGYERRTVAIIDGAATAEGREVDSQHRANRIVNAAVDKGRATSFGTDSAHGDPCDIVVRHLDRGTLTAADWCDALTLAHKQVPNAHKPLVDALIFTASHDIPTPRRPVHPDTRAAVRRIDDDEAVYGAALAVLQEKALADEADPWKGQPDPGHLSSVEAETFRDMWSTQTAPSARLLAGQPAKAVWLVKHMALDRPNKGVGPAAKMKTLARRRAKREGCTEPQARTIDALTDAFIATEVEPIPQNLRGLTEERIRDERARHDRLRRSFSIKLAKVADWKEQPFGDADAALKWLHDIALAAGVIDAHPFATRLDLDAVIREVMGLSA